MANPLRGEIEFVHAGQRFTLLLDVNALCMAEALTGLKSFEISQWVVAQGYMTVLRAALWAALKRHHDLGVEEAGLLLAQLGAAKTSDLLQRAVRAAFPESREKKGSPRKAARGTGSNSSAAG